MMEWGEALQLNHSLIDRDHKILVGLINDLGEAMSSGQGKEVCADVLKELVSYTKTHFAMEERLMLLHHYSAVSAHRAEHAQLVGEVMDFVQRYEAGTVALSVSLLHFLMEWLTDHILCSDKALAQEIPPG